MVVAATSATLARSVACRLRERRIAGHREVNEGAIRRPRAPSSIDVALIRRPLCSETLRRKHPAFYGTSAGTFESDRRSAAYVAETADKSIYWQGCLWGGRSSFIIPMLRTISSWICQDLSAGIT